jgi:hypothetical protein
VSELAAATERDESDDYERGHEDGYNEGYEAGLKDGELGGAGMFSTAASDTVSVTGIAGVGINHVHVGVDFST